ncbi:MAG: TIGR04086 family membrane protein [Eubacteriales bacterium]|nr:TIGR04086 family membrane protein [Bacillota bacterium]MBV1727227.1 TIGR04086 family membrane protein [Desulforudis sp.]MDQ7788507.1 TIGR04086 family membrane protein [Clostridia bacterium]MDZ4043189.1 TIGR04086 family membrane protein [Eubacteriales bacterium]MBU4532100.1 TIGR04086 family membrane protein [Bacillota bacterium]
MTLKSEASPSQPLNFPAMGKGLVATLVLTVGLIAVSGLIFHFSSASENLLPWVTALILFFSVLAGSGLAAMQAGTKGLVHGIGVGILFFLAIWFLVVLLPGSFAVVGLAYKLLIAVAAGALGGVLGVALS